MRKLFDNIKTTVSLNAEAMSAATVGANVIDTQGYADGMLLAVAGDITCTTGDTYTIKVMECDTSAGTFTASGIEVVFSGSTGALALENTTKSARIAELNLTRKRFLRVDLAMTATTTAWEGAGIILLGHSDAGATNND